MAGGRHFSGPDQTALSGICRLWGVSPNPFQGGVCKDKALLLITLRCYWPFFTGFGICASGEKSMLGELASWHTSGPCTQLWTCVFHLQAPAGKIPVSLKSVLDEAVKTSTLGFTSILENIVRDPTGATRKARAGHRSAWARGGRRLRASRR